MSTEGKYKRISWLGDGTYGVVYKAKDAKSGEIVALKRTNIPNEEEGTPGTSIREIAVLKRLTNENVVKLSHVLFEPPKMTLVFEYCEWDLKKFQEVKGSLDLAEIRHFLKQLLLGLAFCHHRSIVHRDLKPQNLLICDVNSTTKAESPTEDQLKSRKPGELCLKIADFGLARVEGIPVKKYSHEAVTLWYRSPDVIMGSTNYGLPVDMWSVGCIFAEMASGVPMFNAKTEHEQLLRMFKILGSPTKDTWPSMSKYPNTKTMMERPGMDKPCASSLEDYCERHNINRIGEHGMDLLKKMLRYEPADRITADDALEHEFFKSGETPEQEKSLKTLAHDGGEAPQSAQAQELEVGGRKDLDGPALDGSTNDRSNSPSPAARRRDPRYNRLPASKDPSE